MSNESEEFSTDISQRGADSNGPISFLVKVRPRMPDFLSSVNLKYVKLGYGYLINHRLYLLLAPPLLAILINHIGKFTMEDLFVKYNITEGLFISGVLLLMLYIYIDSTPRSTYLIDFSCFRPSNDYKISKEEFTELAKTSGNFNESAIKFQEQVLKKSGIGDETYLPKAVFRPGYTSSLKEGREELSIVMFGAIKNLLAATKVKPKDIKILIVNCGILNTTPSISSMVINHFKLRPDIRSFNLGGMGCAAGIVAVDLAKDLLDSYPGSYALVVSTEAVSYSWYSGNDFDMLLPNCFFRMGASAVLLSNYRLDRWRAKYELKQLVRTHKGMDNKSYKSIHQREDNEGKKGLSISKDVIEVGGHALKANITTLGPLVLPISEQLHFFTNLVFKKNKTKPYIPDFKLAFEHVCALATSKKVLDEIQKNLELTEEYMEASRKTLERFGNTSSSSNWYELAYLEFNERIKKGDRVFQIAFGSGFMCNSVVWKALRNVGKPKQSPWIEDDN
ncbi:3-ketoacyl-CoA synthase 15-like [Vicia villosa]|uniref:3-ketoacyl-CoA synthase 15-like n=1 Tax=Vicia villosa TaxID=3911 RepID=UPI00273B2558|nr:3-ketoacyl-CoA synthase 15-like [Vicia villosa]